MSKKISEIPENNIPEVDVELEEDSLVHSNQPTFDKVKTQESNEAANNI